jgi:hypothetical protein
MPKAPSGAGLTDYLSSKIEELEFAVRDKSLNLKRLEAQRNKLNSQGAQLWAHVKPCDPSHHAGSSLTSRLHMQCACLEKSCSYFRSRGLTWVRLSRCDALPSLLQAAGASNAALSAWLYAERADARAGQAAALACGPGPAFVDNLLAAHNCSCSWKISGCPHVQVMSKSKVLVKVHPEGKYVVDIDPKIEMAKVVTGARVALKNDSYTLHLLLPTKVDPLVSLMKVEKVPDSTYDMVGGLDQQIREIKEARSCAGHCSLQHVAQLGTYRIALRVQYKAGRSTILTLHHTCSRPHQHQPDGAYAIGHRAPDQAPRAL